MMSKKYLYTIVAALAIGLSGCDNSSESANTATSNGNAPASSQVKEVEIVINENSFPFSFVDDSGKFSGYDGELLAIIDEKLPEYSFHFNAVSRDAMLVGLSTGTYNLAANHFYINKERAEKYDYSKEPTGLSDLRLIVRNNDSEINSLADFAKSEKRLVPIHVSDARYQVIADYNAAHPDNQIVLKATGEQTAADIFKSVASGEYDAAIYPIGAFLAVTKQIDLNLKVSNSVGIFPNVFLYSKTPDSAELLKAVDKVLVDLKNDGTLAKLSIKWLGEDVYALDGAKDIKVPASF
ncbi:amino acid ABC transporter substrate-binding protein [Brenneria goodwinii]|nr:transporter substrate-binding domain-containing protein [Brenneria goodwinii]ATA23301.1 amino acid ABC transporter substrate-binding protein [Brenneria goodwinii]